MKALSYLSTAVLYWIEFCLLCVGPPLKDRWRINKTVMNKNKTKSKRLVKMTQCELPSSLHIGIDSAVCLWNCTGALAHHCSKRFSLNFDDGNGERCPTRFETWWWRRLSHKIYARNDLSQDKCDQSALFMHFSLWEKNPTTAKCLTQCGKKTTKQHRIFCCILNFRDGALYIIISWSMRPFMF